MSLQNLSGMEMDEYVLRDLLGQGGMSAVYRGYQEELDRYVAVKVLSSRLSQQPGYIERFQGEAKMAASLEHPHIVPVYDFGTKDDLSFVVMRYLTGGTLKERLQSEEPMRLRDVSRLLDNLARALDYAHGRGIVHRDIKPANVMFDDQGTVYLVDFGIAKAVNADVQLTADNIVLGTPAYMAPEQWRADPLTPALDQYALAVVVFAMITGKLPFDADTSHSLMNQHLNEQPPAPKSVNSDIPQAVSEVVLKALSKDANARYPRVTNFANAFKQAINIPDTPTSKATAEAKAVSQHPPANATIQSKAVREPEPAQVTMPNQRVSQKPSQQGIQQPLPRTQLPPDDAPGQRTLFNQFAMGGAVGLLMLFGLVIALIIGVLLFVDSRNNDDDNSDAIVQIEDDTITDDTDNTTGTIDDIIQDTAPTSIPIDGSITVTTITAITPYNSLFNQPETPVRDAAYGANGMVASAHGDNLVRLWQEGIDRAPVTLNGHTDVATAVDFSPDGSLLASGGRDDVVIVWNTATAQRQTTLTGHTGPIRDVTFSPDGRLIASAGEDGTIRIWDVPTGTQINLITADIARVLAVAFSPDGSLIASGGSESAVKVWDVVSGARRMTFSGHTEEVRSVAFSPNGNLLASSSTDNSLRLWDVASGNGTLILPGHGRDVWTAVFHPSGTAVATGGRDNSLRVWDAITGEQIALLNDFSGWVLGVDFSADGSRMVSGAGDGTVRVWALE